MDPGKETSMEKILGWSSTSVWGRVAHIPDVSGPVCGCVGTCKHCCLGAFAEEACMPVKEEESAGWQLCADPPRPLATTAQLEAEARVRNSRKTETVKDNRMPTTLLTRGPTDKDGGREGPLNRPHFFHGPCRLICSCLYVHVCLCISVTDLCCFLPLDGIANL